MWPRCHTDMVHSFLAQLVYPPERPFISDAPAPAVNALIQLMIVLVRQRQMVVFLLQSLLPPPSVRVVPHRHEPGDCLAVHQTEDVDVIEGYAGDGDSLALRLQRFALRGCDESDMKGVGGQRCCPGEGVVCSFERGTAEGETSAVRLY